MRCKLSTFWQKCLPTIVFCTSHKRCAFFHTIKPTPRKVPFVRQRQQSPISNCRGPKNKRFRGFRGFGSCPGKNGGTCKIWNVPQKYRCSHPKRSVSFRQQIWPLKCISKMPKNVKFYSFRAISIENHQIWPNVPTLRYHKS